MAKVALGADPQAEKMKAREGDTLSHIHQQYLEQIRTKNKSWRQADSLMRKHVLHPNPLGGRKLKDITPKDMWRLFDGLHDRPVLANSVLASVSAVFRWAVERHLVPTTPAVVSRTIRPNPSNASCRMMRSVPSGRRSAIAYTRAASSS